MAEHALRDCKPVLSNTMSDMMADCDAAFENRLTDNRDKGEQADNYLGLEKPFEKVHHRRLKKNASSHQIRNKTTIDIVGLIH